MPRTIIYGERRTCENAPEAVREQGGVALSLWLTGAGEADCIIVAIHVQKLGLLRGALEEARALIQTAAQDGYVGAGWCEDAQRWQECWSDA